MGTEIEIGKTYWVEWENTRFQAIALKPTSLPEWWLCKSQLLGEPVVIPIKAIKAEALPD